MLKPIKCVTITDLDHFETFTRFHLSECMNQHEEALFMAVMASRDTVKMGTSIADPIF